MKLTRILIISFCIILILSQTVFALEDILDDAESWIGSGKEHVSITMNTDLVDNASSELYSLLLAVATAVAIIVGAILGIQYMTAGIDRKVEVKESLFPYLISCIVVFGSLGIWRLVVTIAKNI